MLNVIMPSVVAPCDYDDHVYLGLHYKAFNYCNLSLGAVADPQYYVSELVTAVKNFIVPLGSI